MQIEKISGFNIASLAAPFSVDLTSDEIRGAGLFAITGQTGSGKSSILDAMCLALYGDCPRLTAEGVNDDIADSEDSIKASDPRSILRRGASEAEACVEFRANDGASYRAVWKVRRANGNVAGRLQSVDRALYRVDDGALLCSQITSVKERVTQLTGLTYDEFRRTVLLAQGDFDAFLKAKTADRAALLEKVTGTRIYRDISKRVYDRAQEAKNCHTQLELRLKEHVALDPEHRVALEAEIEGLKETLGTKAEIRSTLEADIQKHVTYDGAKSRHADAEEKAKAAQQAQDNAEPLRKEAAELSNVLTMKPDYLQLKDAGKQVRDHHSALTSAAEKRNAAQVALDGAQVAVEGATLTLQKAEDIFKSFGEDWSKATGLDSQIVTARAEYDTAKSKAQSQKALFVDLKNKHRETSTYVERERENLTGIKAKIDKLEGFKAFAPQKANFLATMKERVRLGAEIQTRKDQLNGHQARLELLKGDHSQLKLSESAASGALEEIRGHIQTLKQTLKDIDTAAPSDRMMRIKSAIGVVSNLIALSNDYRAAEDRRALLMSQRDQAREEVASAKSDHAQALPRLKALADDIERQKAPLSLVEAAASASAEHLRQSLIPGEPCPVCASRTHPVETNEALVAAAKALRAELTSKTSEHDALQRQIWQLERKIDALSSKIGSVSEDITTASEALDRYTQRFNEDTAELNRLGAAAHLPAGPGAAGTTLVELKEKLQRDESDIRADIELERKTKTELEGLERQSETITAQQAKRAAQISKLAEDIAKTETTVQMSQGWLTDAESKYLQLEGELAEPLQQIGCSLASLDHQKEERIDKIAYAFDLLDRLSASADKTKAELNDLEKGLEASQIKCDTAAVILGELDEAVDLRKSALDDLMASRSGLLDGEPTEQHRSRHNQMRLDAQSALKRAEEALSSARSEFSGWQSRYEEIAAALKSAEDILAVRQEAFDQSCQDAGLSQERVEALLPSAAEAHSKITIQLKEIESALLRANESLDQRKADVDRLLEAGLPEVGKDILVSDLEALKKESEALISRRAEISEKLSADDQKRAAIRALSDEIDIARSDHETWHAVNDAIGSRSGDKFAKIAQSVTLAILVERANRHLEEIAPRYRLVVGGHDLSLKIVDLDMADDIRSTRSLSGGERFLVSLSLSLALSGMGRHGALAGTLFIDEGFGSLDAGSLDTAIDALEALQSQGRLVGVISHVEALKDRIPVQVKVRRRGNGASVVEVAA